MSDAIGRRYARALLLALTERQDQADELARVDGELTAMAGLMSTKAGEGNAEFRHAMLNPSFSPEDREMILRGIAE